MEAIKRLETELRCLRARSADIIPDADTKYHKLDSGWMLALPRPQVPRGSIAGNKSAARAAPTGAAHAGLERGANPRQQIAARPDYLVAAAGGDAAAGSAPAQGSPQQQNSGGDGQGSDKQVSAAHRLIKKAAERAGSPDDTDGTDSVTECVRLHPWIKKVLSDREIQLMRSAHLQQSVQKSVKSKRVGGGGGDSRESRHSEIGSMSSIAAQGAAAECQDLATAANSPSAAAAKISGKGGSRVDRKRNSRARPAANNSMFGGLEPVSEQSALEAAAAEVAARDAEIERLCEENMAEANRFSAINRDLQQRLRDEKKITDGVLFS